MSESLLPFMMSTIIIIDIDIRPCQICGAAGIVKIRLYTLEIARNNASILLINEWISDYLPLHIVGTWSSFQILLGFYLCVGQYSALQTLSATTVYTTDREGYSLPWISFIRTWRYWQLLHPG